MHLKEFEDNKGTFINDLNRLSLILNELSICSKTAPLNDAMNVCFNESNDEFWIHKLYDLEFDSDNIYAPGGTIPIATDVDNIKIMLSLEAKGKYYSSNIIQNPLESITIDKPYSCDIEILSNGIVDGTIQDLYAAWHFDKDLDYQENADNTFIHPHYHWTFGGTKMEEKNTYCGHSLILPAPRISHPPFDIILAIDYIIKHYMENLYINCLLEDTEYVDMVHRSQMRLWRPFALSFASYWYDFNSHTDLNIDNNDFYPRKIFPELLSKKLL